MTKKAANCALIVMGVCGVGKTSVSQGLADRLQATYVEADDYHPAGNVAAMAQGVPLSDEMRLPWLTAMSQAVEIARQVGPVVVACSALKRRYRDLIRGHVAHARFVHLHGTRDLIVDRLKARKDHFMSPSLLDSQLKTLEPPDLDETAITVDVAGSPNDVITRVETALRATRS